ncbi:MAG: surface protein [Bacteriovoracaceae bacterium]|jgi:surface protein
MNYSLHLIYLSLVFLIGCEPSTIKTTINAKDILPIVENRDVLNIVENRESLIILPYSDESGKKAIACSILNLSEVKVSTACSCNSEGDCSVGIQSTDDYTGNASFDYRVKTETGPSNISTITFEVEPSIPFVSTWRTTTPNETISLPLKEGYKYNFKVDWGDGSAPQKVISASDLNKNHTYTSAGDYIVTISGLAQAWYFAYTGSRNNIISVANFGNLGWIDLASAFSGCKNLESFSGGETQTVTTVATMFYKADKLTNVDLSSWRTPSLTNLRGMFYEAKALSSLDISNFDTSSVTDMSRMFYKVNAITTLDLSHFNTSKVTDMTLMFLATSNLTSLDLSNFNTKSVTSMSNMFNSMSSITSLDLSHFDTSNVEDMSLMFLYTKNLVSLNVDGWDISSVTSSTDIFKDKNAGLVVTCDQVSNTFFTEACI